MHNLENSINRVFVHENVSFYLVLPKCKASNQPCSPSECRCQPSLGEWLLFTKAIAGWDAASSPGCRSPSLLSLLPTGLDFPMTLPPSILQPRFITSACSSACLRRAPSACPVWNLPSSACHTPAGQVSCCHHFGHWCRPAKSHRSECHFTAVGLAVLQDFVLVNRSPLVMLTKINAKHNDLQSAQFLIMSC